LLEEGVTERAGALPCPKPERGVLPAPANVPMAWVPPGGDGNHR